MKKALSIVLTVSVLLTLILTVQLPAAASLNDVGFFDYGDYSCCVLEDDTVRIYYEGTASNLRIPSKIKGYTVKEIGECAFSSNSTLKSVTIPDTVETIKEQAFGFCNKLKKITIPNSVQRIEKYAFTGTAWYNSQPNGVVYAGKVAYTYKGVCPTSVTLKKGTVGIAEMAFYNCRSLKKISIPNSVNNVGWNAFENTAWYNSQPNGVVYAGKVAYKYKGTCPAFVKLKNGTVGISKLAFDECKTLKSIDFGNAVVRIEDEAFDGCKSLRSVILSDTVKWIGGFAFSGCPSLKSITIPRSVQIISSGLGESYSFSGDVTKTKNFVIYGYKGSVAQKYAKYYGIKFLEADKLSSPKITKIENTAKGAKLTYGKVPGAVKYRVFMKNNGKWSSLGVTTGTSFIHNTAKSGTKYTYTVRCISAAGKAFTSSYNADGWKNTFIATPPAPTLKNIKSGVLVSWKKSPGAAKYRVFRKTGSGKWTKLIDTTKLSALDKTAKKGKTYTYTVRCITKNGKAYTSAYVVKGKTIRCR